MPAAEIALPQTEFEEAAAELAPERGSADAHALFLENLAEGGANYTACLDGHLIAEPIEDRLTAGCIFIELECEAAAQPFVEG